MMDWEWHNRQAFIRRESRREFWHTAKIEGLKVIFTALAIVLIFQLTGWL